LLAPESGQFWKKSFFIEFGPLSTAEAALRPTYLSHPAETLTLLWLLEATIEAMARNPMAGNTTLEVDVSLWNHFLQEENPTNIVPIRATFPILIPYTVTSE
jgi:hypothetical protein